MVLLYLVAQIWSWGPMRAWAAPGSPPQPETFDESVVYLYAGESTLQVTSGLQRVAVGDPNVADIKILDEDAFILIGISAGHTTMMIWNDHGLNTREIVVTSRPLLDLTHVERLLEGWGVEPSWWKEYLVIRGTVSSSADKEAVGHLVRTLWEPVIDLVMVDDNTELTLDAEAPLIAHGILAALGMPQVKVQVIKDLVILEGAVELFTERLRAGEIARQFVPEVLNLIHVMEAPLVSDTEVVEEQREEMDDTDSVQEPPIILQDIANLCHEWGYNLRWVGEILLLEGVALDPHQKGAIISLMETHGISHIDATTKESPPWPTHDYDLEHLGRILRELPDLSNVTVSQKGKRLIIEGHASDTALMTLAEDLAKDYGTPLGLEVSSLLQIPTEEVTRSSARLIQAQIGIPGLVVRWAGDGLVLQGSLSPREHMAALSLASQYSLEVIDLIEETGLTPLTLADLRSLLDAKTISVTAVGNTVILRGEVVSEDQRETAVALAQAFGYPVIDAIVVAAHDYQQPGAPRASEIEKAIGVEHIQVRIINGSIALEGTVDTPFQRMKAVAIAATFGEAIDLIEICDDPVEDKIDNWEPLLQEVANLGVHLYEVGSSIVLEGSVSSENAIYLQALMDREFPHWINRLAVLESPSAPLPALSLVESLLDNPAIQCQYVDGILVLQGTVSSEIEREQAEATVSVFAMPLHNLLTVHEEIQQVWVDVCMLEISHSDGREVGLDWRIGLGSKDSGYESLPMSQGDSWQDSLGENPGNAFGLVVGPIWAEAHLLSLLRSGDARILASPSLLAENAQAAEFLAGGEIPIPTDLGIEWKPYGVGLKVKPTIQADGSIHLQVEPEVSSLDWENAVQLEDAVIPGIRTRRWRTQAAIKPGKALVIGGLLSEEESSRRKQVPLLGELPILGALFRSEVAAGQKTDLVVIVSPRLLQDDDPLWTDILPPQ